MVGGGHDLVLSLGLDDGNARTRWLKRGCLKKDGKINNKNNALTLASVFHLLRDLANVNH